MGDGVLVEFLSAVAAVQFALRLAHEFNEANRGVGADRQILLRIGINIGDVVLEGSDLLGDGVNVAARLEALAQPGGICISQAVYEQVKRNVQAEFEELGPQVVKNRSEPVVSWRVRSLPPAGGAVSEPVAPGSA